MHPRLEELSSELLRSSIYTFQLPVSRVGEVLEYVLDTSMASQKRLYFRPVGQVFLVYLHHKIVGPIIPRVYPAQPRMGGTRQTTVLLCKMELAELVQNFGPICDNVLAQMHGNEISIIGSSLAGLKLVVPAL